jgi:Zn-dependent peptidase ImmA (M78 family)
MAETVPIKPDLIRWALDRSGLPLAVLQAAFPKLEGWLEGEEHPTYKQLEQFAHKTMTPLGYLYLDEPPDERLGIPDFRTIGDAPMKRPSPNLLETIQVMKRRQTWMRDYLIEEGQPPLDFVGGSKQTRNVISLAARIREKLGLDPDWAEVHATWEAALGTFRKAAERIGILVSSSAVVGLNNHRPLDPQEFRGFVLCDEYAPLVFVNGADSKSARMFTLAHELAHVWLGKDGLFNLIKMMPHQDETERLCNQVAAELLVPAHKLSERWEEASVTVKPFHTVARWFKVSPVVAARRALDLQLISKAQFFAFYEEDQKEWGRKKADQKKKEKKGSPNFYDVQDVRLGKRFAYAIICAVRSDRLPFREAYQLTDLKGETFDRYANLLTQRMKDERR